MYTGEYATHKNPSPKKRENVHTQMLHLVNRNRKTYQTKREKKKKDQNDSAIRGGIYQHAQKTLEKKIIQKELSRCVTKERTIQLEAKDSREWLEMVIIIIIIIIGRSN